MRAMVTIMLNMTNTLIWLALALLGWGDGGSEERDEERSWISQNAIWVRCAICWRLLKCDGYEGWQGGYALSGEEEDVSLSWRLRIHQRAWCIWTCFDQRRNFSLQIASEFLGLRWEANWAKGFKKEKKHEFLSAGVLLPIERSKTGSSLSFE